VALTVTPTSGYATVNHDQLKLPESLELSGSGYLVKLTGSKPVICPFLQMSFFVKMEAQI
jgi:hypothetical protein